MTAEVVQAWIGVTIFLLAFVFGARASWRLRRRYLRSRERIEERFRPILFFIVVAVWIITLACGWIGGLSMIRLITDMVFPWTPPITLAVVTVVVFIPVMFDVVIGRVASSEDEDADEPGINRFVKRLLFRGQSSIEDERD